MSLITCLYLWAFFLQTPSDSVVCIFCPVAGDHNNAAWSVCFGWSNSVKCGHIGDLVDSSSGEVWTSVNLEFETLYSHNSGGHFFNSWSPLTGERGGSVVEYRTPEREVGGSKPTAAVLCPWARHFTPRKYWLVTQEAVAPSRHDWKIVDWDVKPHHKQNDRHLSHGQ